MTREVAIQKFAECDAILRQQARVARVTSPESRMYFGADRTVANLSVTAGALGMNDFRLFCTLDRVPGQTESAGVAEQEAEPQDVSDLTPAQIAARIEQHLSNVTPEFAENREQFELRIRDQGLELDRFEGGKLYLAFRPELQVGNPPFTEFSQLSRTVLMILKEMDPHGRFFPGLRSITISL